MCWGGGGLEGEGALKISRTGDARVVMGDHQALLAESWGTRGAFARWGVTVRMRGWQEGCHQRIKQLRQRCTSLGAEMVNFVSRILIAGSAVDDDIILAVRGACHVNSHTHTRPFVCACCAVVLASSCCLRLLTPHCCWGPSAWERPHSLFNSPFRVREIGRKGGREGGRGVFHA